MATDNLNVEPLAVWEAEGGNTGALSGDHESELPLPLLPAGYCAQPQWGFEDETGRLIYEFHRVYRTEKVERARARYLEGRLEPDLCYWIVSWTGRSSNGDEHPVARWITYGQARKQATRLSFTRFSTEKGPWLRSLLHVDDIVLPPPVPLKEQVVPSQVMGLG
jgi:hypothetical protein